MHFFYTNVYSLTEQPLLTRKVFDIFSEIFIIRPTRRRGGRVAEGAPLLREYRVCSSIEGSNPSFSAIYFYKWYLVM